MLALQQQIAGDIANKLRSNLSGAEKQQVTQNAEVYALYVKGRFHWNKRTAADINTAIDLFHQALDKDPSYALAYSGLADAYLVLATYGRAFSLLRRRRDSLLIFFAFAAGNGS